MSDHTFQGFEAQPAPNQQPAAAAQQQRSSYWGSQALPEPASAAGQPVMQQQFPAQQQPMGYTAPAPQQQLAGYPAPMPQQQQAGYPAPEQHGPLSTESFIGGKVLGIVAAVLVVTGVFLLGITLVPHLSELLKTVFMFLFALALTGAGIVTTRRARSIFSQTLLSCGMLSFFVAVMSMRAEFGFVAELPALTLTVVWMVATIAIVLAVRSWPASMVLLACTALMGGVYMEEISDAGGYAVPFFIAVAYCVSLGVAGMKLAAGTEDRPGGTRALASLFVAEMGLLLAPFSQWHHAASVVLVVLAVALIVLKATPLPTALRDSALALRVNELVVLCLMALGLTTSSIWPLTTLDYTCGSLFVLGALVLTGLRIRDLAASDAVESRPAIPVIHAVAMTGLVLSYLFGFTHLLHEPATYSAVAMVCSLAAIVVGFACNHKPLRVYGLVVMLLCVLKIVGLDITGTDLERGIAFVVGGLACFGVSALYTYASKHVRS